MLTICSNSNNNYHIDPQLEIVLDRLLRSRELSADEQATFRAAWLQRQMFREAMTLNFFTRHAEAQP